MFSDLIRLLWILVIAIFHTADGENLGAGIPGSDPSDPVILPNLPLPKNPFADDTILSLDLARETVLLAGVIPYQIYSEQDLRELLPSKYTLHTFLDVGSTEMWIVSSETTADEAGKIIVIFRGTDDTADGDWLTNLNLLKAAYGPPGKELYATTVVETLDWLSGEIKNSTIGVKVHRGFNQVFSDNMYEHIIDILEFGNNLLGRRDSQGGLYYNNTVHFMGHSLGGVNALLMGTYFAYFHPEIQTYVTSLGAPRPGNLAFKVLAESLPNLSIWRLVYCHDVVSRLLTVKYYHAGHLMLYGCGLDDNTTEVDAYYRHAGDPSQGYAGVPLSLWTVPLSVGVRMFTDHLPPQYMSWMDSAAAFQEYWTTAFASEAEGERRNLQITESGHQGYQQVLEILKAQGAFKGLRGFPITQ